MPRVWQRGTLLPLTTAAAFALSWTLISSAQTAQAPPPVADAVWRTVEQANYASNWPLFPGTERMVTGRDPHGAYLTTYVNEVAQQAIQTRAQTMPAGSMIVKENYRPDKVLAAVTVMYKSPGYDEANGNWFWLKREADGTVSASGKVEGCQNCHQKGHDYIRTAMPKG